MEPVSEAEEQFRIDNKDVVFQSDHAHVLGKGRFSTVYKGNYTKIDETVAVKLYRGYMHVKESFEALAYCSRLYAHKHLVNVFGIMEDPANGFTAVVMEYMELGSLVDLKGMLGGSLEWPLRMDLLIQAAAAFVWIDQLRSKLTDHEMHLPQPILHRFLVSRNFTVKLYFSVMKEEDSYAGMRSTKQISISPMYMSPEIINAKSRRNNKADIWSFGVSVALFSGGEPTHENTFAIMFKIGMGGIPIDVEEIKCAPSIKHLINQCLQETPQERPSFTEIKMKLESIWKVEGYRAAYPAACAKALQVIYENQRESSELGETWQDAAVEDVDYDPQLERFILDHLLGDEDVELSLIGETYLGRGGFSHVYKGTNKKTNEVLAFKVPREDKKVSQFDILREAEIMHKLHHENVVTFRGLLKGPCRLSYGVIAMEFMELGSVLDLKKKVKQNQGNIDWPVLLDVLKQIVIALQWMHGLGKHTADTNSCTGPHCDIKASNMFVKITNNRLVAKLSDFGLTELSNIMCEEQSHKRKGTVTHLPPEVWMNSPHYCQSTDVWSFGVSIFEVAGGRPFSHLPKLDIRDAHLVFAQYICIKKRSPVKLDDVIPCPSSLKSLINKCLQFNPLDRPSFNEILDGLTEIWKRESYASIYDSALSEIFKAIQKCGMLKTIHSQEDPDYTESAYIPDLPTATLGSQEPEVSGLPVRSLRSQEPEVSDLPVRSLRSQEPEVSDLPVRSLRSQEPEVSDLPVRSLRSQEPDVLEQSSSQDTFFTAAEFPLIQSIRNLIDTDVRAHESERDTHKKLKSLLEMMEKCQMKIENQEEEIARLKEQKDTSNTRLVDSAQHRSLAHQQLKQNWTKFIQDLQPNMVIEHLYAKGVILHAERKSLKMSHLTRHETVIQLLETLERKDEDSILAFVQGLQQNQQEDLAKLLQCPAIPDDEILQQKLERRKDYRVSQILCNSLALLEWPNIVRCLGMKEHDIKAIERDYPREVKSQCMEAVIRWWGLAEHMDEHAKIKHIIRALKKEDLLDVAGHDTVSRPVSSRVIGDTSQPDVASRALLAQVGVPQLISSPERVKSLR